MNNEIIEISLIVLIITFIAFIWLVRKLTIRQIDEQFQEFLDKAKIPKVFRGFVKIRIRWR